LTGSGVTVAVLDTGIAVHPDLGWRTSRVVGWVDLVNGRPNPYDDNGHGTHVAGIVAGDGTAAREGRYNARLDWTASGASLVGVKVLDGQGSGSASTVIAGINWCIDHRRQYNIRVLNLSLGHPVAESFRTDPLCLACERAWQAGIVVVCAAGNMGRSMPDDPTSPTAYGTILSPGNDPQVITVGATNTMGTATLGDDRVTTYSSRGPSAIDLILKPDIVAPGNNIESLAAPDSLLFQSYPDNRIQPACYSGVGPVRYFRLSGTSMACPLVAGVAALLLQSDPSLKPDMIKARLMVSATKSFSVDPLSCGAGLLNAPAALITRIDAPLHALSPSTSLTDQGLVGIVTSVNQNNVIWGNNLIWGDNKTAARAIYGAASWSWDGSLTSGIWSGDPISPAANSGTDSLSHLLVGD
jgi:serine protease AprX